MANRSAGKASSESPALKPYRGKPAVRNFRGGNGNVGLIRSPVRALALPARRAAFTESRCEQPFRPTTASVTASTATSFASASAGYPPRTADLQFIDRERTKEAQTPDPQSLLDGPLACGVDVSRGGAFPFSNRIGP